MKKLILIYIFLSINLLNSQDKKVLVVYEITNLSIGKPIYVKAKLFIDSKKSLYTIDTKDTKFTKEDKATFEEKNNVVKKVVYKSSKNNLFLVTNRKNDTIEQTSGSDGYRFIIKERIYPFKWVLQNETKMIGKFECKKATTYFRGRNYIAWYSTKIPTDSGPWKFSGLPGLILEVYDFDKLFVWNTKKVVYPYKEDINIDILEKSDLNKMELKKYVAIKDQSSQNYSKIIKSKMPKGAEFTDMKIKRKGIELVYEWEQQLEK